MAAQVAARAGTEPPASRGGHRAGFVVYGPPAPAASPVRRRPSAEHHRRDAARPWRHLARRAEKALVRRSPARVAYRHLAGRAAAVVAYAYAQLGVPYVFGGGDRGGFDCSGLTMRAYRRAGVRLPHLAAAQTGRPVSLGEAQPGDLVKWGDYHVGVYVGHGYVVHAPKPGDRVKKSRLWGSYRIVRVL